LRERAKRGGLWRTRAIVRVEMNPSTTGARLLFVVALAAAACGDDGSGGSPADGGAPGDGGSSGDGAAGGGPGCSGDGKPEMTGPIAGLSASYAAGDPMDITVPVDDDTARVIVGIYEVGSALYLGGTAEEASAGSASLSLFAGVADGETGTFYLSVELCSTSVCTPPFVRNTYDRADKFAPELTAGETYIQTRENVGGPADAQDCPSDIAIQSFVIE
jgi:hypothetical protein